MKTDRDECFISIQKNLTRTSAWRRSLQAKYPDQPNGNAADISLRLAREATTLSDAQWSMLQPFYDWSSVAWHGALSDASQHVGFYKYIVTLDDYVEHLANLLVRQTRVAA